VKKTGQSQMLPFRGPGRGGPFAHLRGDKVSVKNAGKTLFRLWTYIRKYKFVLILIFFVIGITSLANLAGPYLISIAIDVFIKTGDIHGLGIMIIVVLILFLVNSVLIWLYSFLLISVSQKTVRNLRKELFDKFQILDIKYFDSRTHGELMSRMTNDIQNISNVMSMGIAQFITSILSVTGVTVMMIILSWQLALVTIGTVPIVFIFISFLGKKVRKHFRRQQEYLGELNGIIEETITGQKVVKAFCREEKELHRFQELNKKLKRASISAQIAAGYMGPSMNMLNNIRFALVSVAGGIFAYNSIVTVGIIAAFLNYSRQFGRPLSQLAQLYNQIQSAIAGAERVFEVIDEKPEITDHEKSLDIETVTGSVEFKNVFFSYTSNNPVLKNISLKAESGRTVALVGPTGAGKTTIVNLITRFYDIESGSIKIDGIEIKDFKIPDLRKKLGIVLQDTFLFSGTVKDNIRYGRLDATFPEIIKAAETADAHKFISHLPEGYDTHLSLEGSNLSEGQKQLIAICRVILADPSILILDEATSSVDTHTEKEIQKAMLHLMKGRTSFIIAHRLSTVRNADKIIVIDKGRIIEQGTHKELLELDGFYAKLHNSISET
jgi:ATP-binding cassette, subfamily B, multidrug efflux pump